MMPGAGGDVNTTLPLVLNIISAVICMGSCLGLILGVVGVIFAVQAGSAKGAGDLETARAKAKTAMILFIVNAVLNVLFGIAYGVLMVVSRGR